MQAKVFQRREVDHHEWHPGPPTFEVFDNSKLAGAGEWTNRTNDFWLIHDTNRFYSLGAKVDQDAKAQTRL